MRTISFTRIKGTVSRRAKCYRRKIRRAKTGVTETSVSKEGTGVGPKAQREYLGRMRERYVIANRKEKGRLLDEAVAVTGRHRKGLIRAWRVGPRPPRRRRAGRPIRYGPAAVRALVAIWTAAGYPWSVRLKALLPTWLPWARRRVALSPATEAGLRQISARQIDRVLAPHKRTIRRRQYGRTKPGTLLKHHIPLSTDRWKVSDPGFTEVELVAHSGDRGRGVRADVESHRHSHDVGGKRGLVGEEPGAGAGNTGPAPCRLAVRAARDRLG